MDRQTLTFYQENILKLHGKSVMHRDAQDCELAFVQFQRNGGIPMAFEKENVAQGVAVQCALKVVYWLCKEEVVHTTTYVSNRFDNKSGVHLPRGAQR